MGIDIASWRIYIGSFLSTHMASTNPLCKSTKATKWSSYRRSTILLSFVLLAFASSLTICMDIEPNPGPHPIVMSRQPTTAASDPTTPYTYTSLFNATKRIYLKLTRHKHHLLNYSFYKENIQRKHSKENIQRKHSSITIPTTATTIHELQILPTMEIHFTLCCLPTPEAFNHRMQTQDQDTFNGTLTPHGTLTLFLYV